MVNYDYYLSLLREYNFTNLPDNQAADNLSYPIEKGSNGDYLIRYQMPVNQAVLLSTGYYSISDPEYIHFRAADSVQQALINVILNPAESYSVLFSDVADIDFERSAIDEADIVFMQNDGASPYAPNNFLILETTNAYAHNYFDPVKNINSASQYGDIIFNEDSLDGWESTEIASIQYYTVLHEIAHSLGLKHPEHIQGEGMSIDNQKYTIMSINHMAGMEGSAATFTLGINPSGLQLYDIAALQEIYGRNYEKLSDNTEFTLNFMNPNANKSMPFIYTIWDGGGTADKIDASGSTIKAVIDLRQGEFSSIGYSNNEIFNADGIGGFYEMGQAKDNVAIAFYAVIENAKGTDHDDILIGNAWNNKLVGGGGSDRIFGDGASVGLDSLVSQIKNSDPGFREVDPYRNWDLYNPAPAADDSGNDILIGGDGEDWLYGGAGHDTVDYAAETAEPGVEGRRGIEGSLDINGNGAIIDTYGHTDHLYGIEALTMTGSNDDLSVAGVIGRAVDGGGGTDTLHYSGYIVWDMAQFKYMDGTGTYTDTISNVEAITFDYGRILPNLSADLGMALSRFKMVDYSSTSAGATINVLSDSYIHDLGSHYSGQLLLSAEILVNGHTHDYSFGGGSASSSIQANVYEALRDSTRAVIAGTGGGDTININGSTLAILPVSINGGKGNDTINVSGGGAVLSGLTIAYGIDGGDDIVNGAGAVTEIYLGGNIRHGDVTRSIGVDDAEINIAGYGKITLNDYVLGTVIRYGDGRVESLDGSIVYSAGGIGAPEDITGSEQADVVVGLMGDDIVHGYAGNDTLEGRQGNDILYGGLGNDIYMFAAGDGYDTIYDRAGNNTLRITGAISSSDLAFARVGDDLRIEIGSGVTLKDYFVDFSTIEKIVFDSEPDFYIYSSALMAITVPEGAVLDNNLGHAVNGTAANDFIYGFGGNDTLNGFAGDDVLNGGEGDDLYIIGEGFDVVYDEAGGNDIVEVNASIADVRDMTYTGGDLRIDLGNGNGVLIEAQNNAPFYQNNIETIRFSDAVLPDHAFWQVLDALTGTYFDGNLSRLVLGSAIDEMINGGGGNDIISGGSGNDTLYGGAGSDVLYGGAGDDILGMDMGLYDDDILAGGEGSDIYQFRANSGDAIIIETSGFDVVESWFELRFPDFSFSRAGDDLLISTVSNTLTVRGQYSGDEDRVVEYLRYFDGTEVQSFDLRTLVFEENTAPVARDDEFTVNEDAVLTGNVLADNGAGADFDLDGDTITVTAGTFVTLAGGSVILAADGSFTYAPVANFHGPDSFTYHISDGQGGSDSGTVSITVASVNDGPVAQNDLFAGIQDIEISGNLFADNGHGADSDPDGGVLRLVQEIVVSAAGGSVVLMHNGDFVYTPPAGFFGNDSFEYTLSDSQGGEATATAFITLEPANRAPEAQDDNGSGFILETIGGNVLADNGHGADSDPDGDSLSVQPAEFRTASGGLVVLDDDGHYAYTAVAGFTGTESFTYTLFDGQGGSDAATVTLTVGLRGNEIVGSGRGEFILGTQRSDVILAKGGDDFVLGRQSADKILGGSGKDFIHGQNGDDLLIGGSGSDQLYGGNGNDILIGDDVLIIGSGAGTRYMQAGLGGEGDCLDGGNGSDLLMGGAGNDTLTGGNGADVFKFLAGANGKDRITDFDARDGDKIDISDVLENSYDPLADLISQFAKIDRQGHNYTLSVDADGADNGANFTAIAVFDSHRQLTLESMIQNGSLIV